MELQVLSGPASPLRHRPGKASVAVTLWTRATVFPAEGGLAGKEGRDTLLDCAARATSKTGPENASRGVQDSQVASGTQDKESVGSRR